MAYSDTTKYNCLHTLRDMKQDMDKNEHPFSEKSMYLDFFWDEYDLDYLIGLVEKDING